jgi:hypothetical protein
MQPGKPMGRLCSTHRRHKQLYGDPTARPVLPEDASRNLFGGGVWAAVPGTRPLQVPLRPPAGHRGCRHSARAGTVTVRLPQSPERMEDSLDRSAASMLSRHRYFDFTQRIA